MSSCKRFNVLIKSNYIWFKTENKEKWNVRWKSILIRFEINLMLFCCQLFCIILYVASICFLLFLVRFEAEANKKQCDHFIFFFCFRSTAMASLKNWKKKWKTIEWKIYDCTSFNSIVCLQYKYRHLDWTLRRFFLFLFIQRRRRRIKKKRLQP